MEYMITVRKADGTLAKIPADEEFIQRLHDNYKDQMNECGYDVDGMKDDTMAEFGMAPTC